MLTLSKKKNPPTLPRSRFVRPKETAVPLARRNMGQAGASVSLPAGLGTATVSEMDALRLSAAAGQDLSAWQRLLSHVANDITYLMLAANDRTSSLEYLYVPTSKGHALG